MSDATSYVGDLKVFSADDADEEWVIAKSAADAAAVWQEIAGAPLDFGDGQVAWVEVDPTRTFPVRENGDGAVVGSRTAAEYAKTWPRGGFMSANF